MDKIKTAFSKLNMIDQSKLHLIDNSGFFDRCYYVKNYGRFIPAGQDPLVHYAMQNSEAQFNPHPLFDSNYYTQHCKRPLLKSDNPLVHFLESPTPLDEKTHILIDPEYYFKIFPQAAEAFVSATKHFLLWGNLAGMNPHPLFDITYYKNQLSNLEQNSNSINYLIHFLLTKNSEVQSPHPLFDCNYYLSHSEDCKNNNLNPLIHYLTRPTDFITFPHPLFDEKYYLSQFSDYINVSPKRPLENYILNGLKEPHSPHPLFDNEFYCNVYPDIFEVNLNPLVSYLTSGADGGRLPCPAFDTAYFNQQYQHLNIDRINPLIFYLNQELNDLNPNPLFQTKYYLNQFSNPIKINPLIHFLKIGHQRKIKPHLLYHYNFEELNDLEKDKTIFIFGAGPQLNELTESQLKILKLYPKIGMNRADYKLDMDYIITPYLCTAAIAKHRNAKVKTVLFRPSHEFHAFGDFALQGHYYNHQKPLNKKFSSPVPLLFYRNNSVFAATHLAYVLGAKKIVYIGVEQNNANYFFLHDADIFQQILIDYEYWKNLNINDPIYPYTTYGELVNRLLVAKENQEANFDTEDWSLTLSEMFKNLELNFVNLYATKKESVIFRAGAEFIPLNLLFQNIN